MNIKLTVADRIRSGQISPDRIAKLRTFAKAEKMLLHSIPLKDGTTAKILSNETEYDCLIMKNGKVLTARGKRGKTEEIIFGINEIFEHIKKRNRAAKGVDIDNENFDMFNNYMNNFHSRMSEI